VVPSPLLIGAGLERVMGSGSEGFLVQNRAASQGVLTRWSLVAGMITWGLATVSSNSRRSAIACSSRLRSRARGGVAPGDLSGACPPGAGSRLAV
jgi:hypothetical protein